MNRCIRALPTSSALFEPCIGIERILVIRYMVYLQNLFCEAPKSSYSTLIMFELPGRDGTIYYYVLRM